MRKYPFRMLVGTLVVVYGCLALTFVTGSTPNLGLDLQGGISVNLQPVEGGEVTDDVTDEQLDQAIEIIRRRVDALGVAEPEVSRQGSTITVQLPGAKDQAEVLEVVGKTAQLEFRPVLATVGQVPTGDARDEAEARVAELREELSVPEGITAQQVAEDEQARLAEANPAPADPNAPPPGEEPAVTPDGPAVTEPAAGGGDEGALGRNTAPANGGNRSAQVPTQDEPDDETTTTAAGDAPGTTIAPEPSEPLNQYGVDINDEGFAELFQLEQALGTELTAPEDQNPEVEVVLADLEGNVYRLGPVALTGEAVEGATAGLDQTGQWTVNPSFKAGSPGIDDFNAIASVCFSGAPECPPQSADGRGLLGIVLDDEVLSAPSINVASFDRDSIQISGAFDQEEAEALAVALRFGSLPIELVPQQAENVSATLGQGALEAGILSGFIGLALAAIYLFLYYRLLAVIAMAGLTVAASALWVIMSFVGATVTLAGVVGIVVSIGLTVDSAVVYFESMKESVRNGMTVRTASDRAFSFAWSTIVKANIASLIGAGVLYWLAIGPVRGFAFYLGAMTILDLIAMYVFIYPSTLLLARSKFGQRRRLLGMPAPAEEGSAPAPTPTPTGATS